jgi:hypothetical protein
MRKLFEDMMLSIGSMMVPSSRRYSPPAKTISHGVLIMPLQSNDPLVEFENWTKQIPSDPLSDFFKEYVAESNQTNWVNWQDHHLIGICELFEDMRRGWDFEVWLKEEEQRRLDAGQVGVDSSEGHGEAHYSPGSDLLGLGDQRQEVSKLDKLSSRERRILEARVLADKPMTLDELAQEFGVARARVRQLEARVLEKMGVNHQNKASD